MGRYRHGSGKHSFSGLVLMQKIPDTYKTILRPSSEIIFKEKKSKFFGYAFPVQSETEIKPLLEQLRKKHYTANHVCYAWQLGIEHPRYRANDDGEPNNSAGIPIYGQIQSYEVTNILIAVVRIFGGTKLGVGGLISAYRTAAQMTLEDSQIVVRRLQRKLQLEFEYAKMNRVMQLIKRQQLEIVSQKLEHDCELIVSVDRQKEEKLIELFGAIQKIKVFKIDHG